jgi:8-oxo-dGTP diphosphatase
MTRLPIVAAIVTSRLGVLVARRNDGQPLDIHRQGKIPLMPQCAKSKRKTGLPIRATGVIGHRVHPDTGREMVYLAARPTYGTKALVGDEQELAEVRWVDRAQADELMGGTIFELVRGYLEKSLKAQDSE